MKTVKDYSFENKTALVRVDLNVPLNKDFQVTDDTRIKATIPTIKKILTDGGKAVLMSHLGRPKNGPENKFSLQHIVGNLEEAYGAKVLFSEDTIGEKAESAVNNLKNGEVLLLENVRFHGGETKGDETFAKALSK